MKYILESSLQLIFSSTSDRQRIEMNFFHCWPCEFWPPLLVWKSCALVGFAGIWYFICLRLQLTNFSHLDLKKKPKIQTTRTESHSISLFTVINGKTVFKIRLWPGAKQWPSDVSTGTETTASNATGQILQSVEVLHSTRILYGRGFLASSVSPA